MKKLLIGFSLILFSATSNAQVYQCKVNGNSVFQDKPCKDIKAKQKVSCLNYGQEVNFKDKLKEECIESSSNYSGYGSSASSYRTNYTGASSSYSGDSRSKNQYVSGYSRKDGTYVQPYHRASKR